MSDGIPPTGNQSSHTFTQPTQTGLTPQDQKVHATAVLQPTHPTKRAMTAKVKKGDTTSTQFFAGKLKLFSALIQSIKKFNQ